MSDVDSAGTQQYIERCRDMAHEYLELGWSIIPVRPDTKVPAIEWAELQTRAPTAEEVDNWFVNGVPDGKGGLTRFFGLGLVTGAVSGIVVLDCDTQDALSFALGEAGLFSMLGVRTTRGQHLYFRHPGKGERVTNKVGGSGRDWPDVPGLDLRGDGGYVMLPPSLKFDSDGKFKHQYAWTVPDAELLDAVFGLSVWPGIRAAARTPAPPTAAGEWSFDDLRLDAVRTYGGSVWEQAAERVKKLGRRMVDGDGRNTWMTRYIGECVASGMYEEQAAEAAKQFSSEFFDQPLPEAEQATILQSVFNIDRRNHPEKYQPAPGYKNQTPERAARHAALRLITPSSLAELRKLAQGRRFLIDPYVPPQSIVQVVGFNGHCKSLWLQNTLYAAAQGRDFGSATVPAPVRTLYMDFESSTSTLSARLEDCESLLGPMHENLAMWAKAVSPTDISLADPSGLAELAKLVSELRPQVVVIDTVREAWLGMEENSPHAWVKVNHAALTMRNAGMSVVLVHHRNKPSQSGHGREAGSTAQLKDLDVQVFITKVAEDEDQARREAAIPDSATQVVDAKGRVYTAHNYLRSSLPSGYIIQTVFELTFGKLRTSTENHVPAYFGFAKHIHSGAQVVVSTKTPRQKAVILSSSGKGDDEIAAILQVPAPTVRRWLAEARQKGGEGGAAQAAGA